PAWTRPALINSALRCRSHRSSTRRWRRPASRLRADWHRVQRSPRARPARERGLTRRCGTVARVARASACAASQWAGERSRRLALAAARQLGAHAADDDAFDLTGLAAQIDLERCEFGIGGLQPQQ